MILFLAKRILKLLSKISAKNNREFSSDMSDEDVVRNIGYLAHELRNVRTGGAGVMKYPLKLALAGCRNVVLKKKKAGRKVYDFEEWISDNIRLLLGSLDRIDYRAFTALPHKDGVPRIMVLADFIVKYSAGKVSADRIGKVVNAFNAVTPLSYIEISLLGAAIKYRLLTEISLFAERSIHYFEAYRKAQKKSFSGRYRHSDAYLTYYSETHGDEGSEMSEGDSLSARLGFDNILADNLLLTSAYINSLRSLDAELDDAFTISLSPTDRIYRKDAAYREMSDKARNDYLLQTSKCAERNEVSEQRVARAALEIGDDLTLHFGEILYYYPDALAKYLRSGIIEPLKDEKTRVQGMYSFLVLIVSIVIAAFPAYFLRNLWAYLSVIPIFIAALHPVEYLLKKMYSSFLMKRKPLPQMDYKEFPEECRTVVTVSRFIASKEDVDDALRQIETFASSEKDPAVSYVILADLPSSDTEWGDRDEELYDYFRSLSRSERVSIFLRKRTLIGKKWRGYERKRGALLDFLTAVRERNIDKFKVIGDLPRAEYALLLDDDSELLPGTIRAAILAMAHPLNREYDLMSFGGRINRYSIGTHYSLRFLRGCGAEAYPYYTDFYSDTFDCALYCGKAIVRIAPYLDKLSDFFPDARILSHDIIEGAVLRSTTVKRCVYEDAPTTFSGDHLRTTRWQRGDIQLLPYAFCNRVKDRTGKRIKNPIAPIYKLIIFINGMTVLRDAMILAVLFFAYAAGSIFLLMYALSLFLLIKAYSLLLSVRAFFTRVRFSHAVRGFILSLELLTEEIFLLPFRALSGVYLFVVTCFKMAFRSDNLLEWTPFRTTQKSGGVADGAKILSPTVLFLTAATILLGELWLTVYTVLFMFYAFSLLLSGRDIIDSELSESDKKTLRGYAAKIYRYFEDMRGEGLIPDNLQLFPYRIKARMTSPTNLGFSLLAEVSAAKLGLTEIERAIQNIRSLLDKIDRLERYRGHLYNWYDIETFAVMAPRVISTVDSANFLCCLSVVESFAREQGEYDIAERAREIVLKTDFSILYDHGAKCLAIVKNVDENRLYGRYDLLASESRLAYYLAIAQGLDPECYFSLGRECTSLCGNTLLSWSGTAFEYMLPRIFLAAPYGSLIRAQEERSGRVQRGDRSEGLFGRSECGYYAFNDATAFMYKAVGCRALALSGETSDVIAPYASLLYLPTAPKSCIENLAELSHREMEGEYGFYEAIDFDHDGDIVSSYMTHHQGMSLAAITNALCRDEIVRLFCSLPRNRAIRILLTEDNIYERKPAISLSPLPSLPQRQEVVSPPSRVPDALVLKSGEYTATYDALGRSGAKLGDYRLTKALDYSAEYGGIFVEIKEGDELYSPAFYPYGGEGCYALFGDRDVKYVNPHRQVTMEISLLEGYCGELRKIVLENASDRVRKVTLSGYADMILNTEDAYLSHPAFSDMFVRAEYDEERGTQYLTRRGMDCKDVLSASLMIKGLSKMEVNCNSYNVIGRLGDFRKDYASGVQRTDAPRLGDVLYPCFGFSGEAEIPPHGESVVYLVLLSDRNLDVLKSRNEKIDLAYRSGAIELLGRGQSDGAYDAGLMIKLTGRLLYMRTPQSVLAARLRLKDELGAIGVDPCEDILYFDTDEEKDRKKLTAVVSLSHLLRERGIIHKLLIVTKDTPGAGMSEREAIIKLIRSIDDKAIVLDHETGARFRDGAKIILSKPLEEYPSIRMPSETILPERAWGSPREKACGEGGFSEVGYSVHPFSDATLLPYANVVGGSEGGFVITESGGGFTFGKNSREDKITVWTGDAIRDIRTEEIIYHVRDKRYVLNGNHCEHRIGESRFSHVMDDITMCVSASIYDEGRRKIYDIAFSDDLPLDAFFSLDLILALGWRFTEKIYVREVEMGFALTNLENGKTAYVYSLDVAPTIVHSSEISGKVSFVSPSNLKKGHYRFVLSSAPPERVNDRTVAFSKAKTINALFRNAICVHTSDDYLDRLYNDCLPYQLSSARLNAKTGFYQCSGAYGFRDQLQDVLGVLLSAPDKAREQILLAASHQFSEGDVQHWWHPPFTGVRTRISDDRLWLLYVTERYIEVTGDLMILDESVPFLLSPVLKDAEISRYEIPRPGERAPLREHLLRAIRISLQYGEHSLLKIGSGDWNDGLDRVGSRGKGESVWLTMFAYKVISDALNYYPDHVRRELTFHLEKLRDAVLPLLRDGRYPLAFADDGSWLGYADGRVCRHALNTQTWAVLSGISPEHDARRVMAGAKDLVDPTTYIVKLLSPPFDAAADYGYISAYPKGIRENGGQYTHAAVWYLKALLELGEKEQAYRTLINLNPMYRCSTKEGTMRYKGEPYVLTGDVYGCDLYLGRAGWSWYTGSAGWLKYVLTEDFFGIKRRGDYLYVDPCFPSCFEHLVAEVRMEKRSITIEYLRGEETGLFLNGKRIDKLSLRESGENISLVCRFV